jgi:hypothetical protein
VIVGTRSQVFREQVTKVIIVPLARFEWNEQVKALKKMFSVGIVLWYF